MECASIIIIVLTVFYDMYLFDIYHFNAVLFIISKRWETSEGK